MAKKKNTTKQAPANATTEKAKKAKTKAEATPKRVSAIDAAAKVLAGAGAPMNCQEMIAAMAEKKLWTSPGGKTPHATLYSAILREINTKGKDARFKKTERGKFAAKA
ncbi:MAG TPA: winged helix-turn-helix domain-containing protein [Gemmataceae bacterium]|nr:winged helix-turn-helix domain-containing protein [Gemmataceae bacterium]